MKSLRRFADFLIFRLLPIVLIAGIAWTGIQVAQGIARQLNERSQYEGRLEAYAQTATAIAPTATLEGEVWSDLYSISGQLFVTNTPRPTSDVSFATNTPAVSPTPEILPTETPAAEQPLPTQAATNPLPTIMFLPTPVVDASQALPAAIPAEFPLIDRRGANLMNILLMGQDNEITGEALARTDTMIIVSINRDTNTVAMLSLPRDLFVYMPQVGMQRINVAYAVGESLGWEGGPFFYMRQVILYNLGINVHYFAMVDLSGFATLIDKIGGVGLSVDCPIRNLALIGAEVPRAAQKINEDEYLLPVGYFELSGKEALWYARARDFSDDFDRGRRQQQLLRAAWRKVRDSGLLTDVGALPGLVSEGLAVLRTDLQVQDILGLLPVALQVDPEEIETFRFSRLYHTTPFTPQIGAYAGQNVQLPNPDTVFDLMTDFYTPPTENQIAARMAKIRVRNGTPNSQWDRVAVDRLGWENLSAVAAGDAETLDYQSSIIIDHTGSEKGSNLDDIAAALKIPPENWRIEPDPNREYDFDVIIGADYNSCTGNVLDPMTGAPINAGK